MKKVGILVAIVLLIATSIFAKKSNLPISREATFYESFSPTEVTIRATGYGKKASDAEKDLKKAAVWFVLFSSTDPILQTLEERKKFEQIQEEFFDIDNINKYITWVSSKAELSVKVKKDGKKMKKVIKYVRVNVGLLKQDLVTKGIITSKDEITEDLGTPFIMVLPEAPKGKSPLDLLKNDPIAKAGATVIQSYLTARGYDVQVPEAEDVLNQLTSLHSQLEGVEDDPHAQIAQLIGADIYITYSITIEQGSFGTKKASVTVKAYETTTGRLLGAETGYSPSLKINSEQALIENAIGDAINNVLSRVMAYWKKDLKKGVRYKIVFKITGINGDRAEDLGDIIADVVESNFDKTKELLFTNKTISYIVWASPDEYSSGRQVYRVLRRKIERKARNVKVSRIVVNKKFILIKVSPR